MSTAWVGCPSGQTTRGCDLISSLSSTLAHGSSVVSPSASLALLSFCDLSPPWFCLPLGTAPRGPLLIPSSPCHQHTFLRAQAAIWEPYLILIFLLGKRAVVCKRKSSGSLIKGQSWSCLCLIWLCPRTRLLRRLPCHQQKFNSRLLLYLSLKRPSFVTPPKRVLLSSLLQCSVLRSSSSFPQVWNCSIYFCLSIVPGDWEVLLRSQSWFFIAPVNFLLHLIIKNAHTDISSG